jgi:cardiolipin synthase
MTLMLNLAHETWQLGFAALVLLLALLASGHLVRHNRDSRAAIAWVGFVWLVPLLGAVLYFIFGVNRFRLQPAFLRSNLDRFLG